MKIFKVIYSYLYYLFAKRNYNLLGDYDKEAIYHNEKKSRYVIVVKDVDVGKRLYEVLRKLDTTVSYLPYKQFTIPQYGITRNNSIRWFCIEGELSKDWKYTSRIERLRITQQFVDAMQAQGFVLDDTIFDETRCKYASEFLSYFIESNDENKINRSKGCMIEYIHHVCVCAKTGGPLKQYYENFCNKAVLEGYNIPYKTQIARMCYDYFKKGAIPESILTVLTCEMYYSGYANYSLVAIPEQLESKFNVTEKTDEYTIYDGCMKIYHNMSSEFCKFLADGGIIDRSKRTNLEQIVAVIVDLDNYVIGYKFVKSNEQTITFEPHNQNIIFKYVMDMVKYLRDNQAKNCSEKSKDFDIEKSLVCTGVGRNNYIFKTITVKDLFNLSTADWSKIQEQVTVIFFKLLANYMVKTYGELTSENEFFEKKEIRFLSPAVAKGFVNFALGKTINQAAIDELFGLFYNNRKISSDATFSYDARFSYDPLAVNYVFDYEAESKYNVKLEKDTIEQLPDGRLVVTFKRSRKISAFVDHEKTERANALSAIRKEDEHVKLAQFSELIIGTKRLNNENMYNVIGYVTEPINGVQLTNEILLLLNNKELLQVAAYLFCKFKNKFFNWNNIWMTKDFMFYINYLDDDFTIETISNGTTNSDFVHRVFYSLMEVGYSQNAFVGWEIPEGGFRVTRQYLLDLVKSFDVYCDEHKIYYDSKKGQCPVCEQTKYLVPQDFAWRFKKVFEDEVAIHYNIDPNYNLKIYKPDYKEIVKSNVIRLVNFRTHRLYQDCFRPIKLALDTNYQFIGCVYEVVKFESVNGKTTDVCVDLLDKVKLKNLPRLKSLIRLILQMKDIINNNLGFMINPFTHVFLNTSHKKQVQILNIEFLKPCNRTDLKKTKQWICEYVYKVLQSDPTIEIKSTDLPEGLETILMKLTELSEQMTKYCSIHKRYYKKSYICCPECINPSELTAVIYTNKSKFDDKTPIKDGEGGEAFIYPYSKGFVAKVFKTSEINKDFKNNILFKIFTKKDLLEKVNQEKRKYRYIYPREILVDEPSNEIFAYVMERVENGFSISTLKDKGQIQKLGFSKQDIFEIIITVGEGIEELHKHNIYIGDLNGRNILFDIHKNVYFLDFDGMGVDELAPEFCTDGYIDPLSKKNQTITPKDDWYSFAVQAFYYLTYTHPFNGIYSEERDGRKVKLDIPEKMERRISLLGNHGMEPPKIAELWDWMQTELKFAFLSIFEGNNRESIVPALKKQYQTLSQNVNEQSFDKIYRINPKFVATELEVFWGNILRVINPYAAICESGNEKYVELRDYQFTQLSDLQSISDILFSDDGKLIFVVHDKQSVIVVDIDTKEIIYQDYLNGATRVVVNERTMYFTGYSDGKYIIFKRTFQPDGEIVKESIVIGSHRIKWFDVKFNTKFILITEATQNRDEVYCNSYKFCTFEYATEDMAKRAHYNIIYDETTKSWLVINNFGKGTIIQMSGKGSEIDIACINDTNYANIHFEKGNIYIPGQECIHIYNTDSKTVKKMECRKIMIPESRIYDVNSNGFSVITQNVLYEVRKG